MGRALTANFIFCSISIAAMAASSTPTPPPCKLLIAAAHQFELLAQLDFAHQAGLSINQQETYFTTLLEALDKVDPDAPLNQNEPEIIANFRAHILRRVKHSHTDVPILLFQYLELMARTPSQRTRIAEYATRHHISMPTPIIVRSAMSQAPAISPLGHLLTTHRPMIQGYDDVYKVDTLYRTDTSGPTRAYLNSSLYQQATPTPIWIRPDAEVLVLSSVVLQKASQFKRGQTHDALVYVVSLHAQNLFVDEAMTTRLGILTSEHTSPFAPGDTPRYLTVVVPIESLVKNPLRDVY